jgi:outer membrane protein assembly factor BamE (lipoprotein component of BamABCDE complex)
MRAMKTFPAIIAAIVLLAGCAAPGAVVTSERLDRVRHGMTRDETLRLLGAPDETMRFAGTRTEAWDYRFMDPWGYFASFSVTFGPDGRVVSMLSNRLNDGGDHGSN